MYAKYVSAVNINCSESLVHFILKPSNMVIASKLNWSMFTSVAATSYIIIVLILFRPMHKFVSRAALIKIAEDFGPRNLYHINHINHNNSYNKTICIAASGMLYTRTTDVYS